MKITGTIHKYGDNIDTDVIIPARHLNLPRAEWKDHCMEDIDTEFVNKVRPGDILVAGENFGCGSSREHAPIAIKESGISCIVAKSFARIFYRNAINIGLPILECDLTELSDGDTLSIDLEKGVIVCGNKEYTTPPFPEFIKNIIAAGGLLSSIGGDV